MAWVCGLLLRVSAECGGLRLLLFWFNAAVYGYECRFRWFCYGFVVGFGLVVWILVVEFGWGWGFGCCGFVLVSLAILSWGNLWWLCSV